MRGLGVYKVGETPYKGVGPYKGLYRPTPIYIDVLLSISVKPFLKTINHLLPYGRQKKC